MGVWSRTARRRVTATALAVVVASSLAACGSSSPGPGPSPSQGSSQSTGSPTVGSASATATGPTSTTTGSSSTAHSHSSGSGSSAGLAVFESAGCGGCHTLAAAHATGDVGPDLDDLKPSEALVARQVTNGGAVMPSFAGRLSKAQITAVARFVASAAG